MRQVTEQAGLKTMKRTEVLAERVLLRTAHNLKESKAQSFKDKWEGETIQIGCVCQKS